MFETKSNAVKSTIQATLKTLITLMTDTFNEECRKCDIQADDGVGKVELSRIYDVIYDLLQKVGFALMSFDQPQKKPLVWNLKLSVNSKCVMLDLTNLIL